MEKLVTFPGRSDRGIFTYVIDTESPFLIKTASEYHPEIASYISSAKKIPGKTQILLTALGAGEYWGCNANGDYFAETSLAHSGKDFGYRTFEYNAKVYKHHVNKDPKASYGDVSLSVYNPVFHRVELIVVLDNEKAPDIVEKINNGVYPEWSMGCRVKHDVCSICGNKARIRPEYCEHLRYYMGKLDPSTGKMVYAINPEPVFFDISQVFIGADKVAKTLRKVASLTGTYKEAEIRKEIPVDEPPASLDNLEKDIQALKENDPDLPREMLNDIASKYPLKDVLSTMLASRILPRPHEFQRIILVSIGKKPLADQWDREGVHFDPARPTPFQGDNLSISPDFINEDLVSRLAPIMPHRSFSPHHMMNRVTILVKRANKREWRKIASDYTPPDTSMAEATKQVATAGLISWLFRKTLNEAAKNLPAGDLPKVLVKYPNLSTALGFTALTLPYFFNRSIGPSAIGNHVRMEPDRNTFIERHRERPYTKIAGQGTAGLMTAFGGPLGVGVASDYLNKKRQTDPEYTEGSIKKFVRRYKEPAQLLAAGAGLGLMTGRPIPTKLYNIGKSTLKSLEKAIPHVKMGSLTDFAIDTLVWPMAMGGPNMAHRLVGSAVDQGVFEGLKRLSNKRSKDKLT